MIDMFVFFLFDLLVSGLEYLGYVGGGFFRSRSDQFPVKVILRFRMDHTFAGDDFRCGWLGRL